MLLTVFCLRRDRSELTFSLEVDPDFELQNFRALCELESGVPSRESTIIYAEQPLTDNQRSLSSYGLKDGDVVVLRQKETVEPHPAAPFPGVPRIDFSSIAVPGTSAQHSMRPQRPSPPDSTTTPQGLDNPSMLREMLLSNPHELSLLKERNPPLAEALLSGDLEKFTKVLLEQQQERARREQERIRLFSADPFDLDAQAKIEEDIRQQNIEENMTIAMEEAPESFGQVVMLYINCKVNGYPVKAFVDSGAQMTIMSQACAERCHIMRLVDRRWAGIAKGVGTQKIIGRVHLAQVQIEGDFLPCSFSILEEQPMDMLLGLDMLKRHQCSIDLKKNVLVIGTTGTQTAFLPEGELPECARLAYGPGREDMQPEEIADQELAEALQKSADEAEHGNEETTSLEMPSPPSTDLLNRADNSSGFSSRVCNPPGSMLDRSVSAPASVFVPESSVEENIFPESSTRENTEPHVLKLSGRPAATLASESSTTEHLSDYSSLPGYASPVKAETAVAKSPVIPSKSILQEAITVPDASGHESATSETVEKLASQHLQWRQSKVPSSLNELSNDQPVPQEEETHVDPRSTLGDEDLQCTVSDWQGSQDEFSTEEFLKTSLLDTTPLLVSSDENTAHYMEVDSSVQSLAPSQDTELLSGSEPNGFTVELTPHSCEIEMSSGGVSLPNPTTCHNSNSDHSQNIRIGQVDRESTKKSSISSSRSTSDFPCDALDNPNLGTKTEEPGVSLAAALKELHKLLIVSNKDGSRRATSEEELLHQCQSDHVVEIQEERMDIHEESVENQKLCANSDVLSPEAVFQHEALETAVLGDTHVTSLRSYPKEAESKSVSGFENNPCVVLKVNETQDVLGKDIALDFKSDGTSLACANFLYLPETQETFNGSSDLSESVMSKDMSFNNSHQPDSCSTETRIPKKDDSFLHSETATPMNVDIVLPPGTPVAHPAVNLTVQPPPFPETAIRRILGAGFSLQEAISALEHAGGNVDLALLVLLARNIVVP
ncbi:uncharacterized protein [Pleurodeles waltl]|uniref:uncharacterized protein isoform X1 n=1 Tax=Pleurodeles waltl TaxID=8319 RepID=UPI003709894F